MEFLLINHPLDCPICDQAGECGLQDYSFKHGQAFSRFDYDQKRVYPGRERIPLGPDVLLNMNRCIQCTRCIRFTEEISGTGELGFFQRGARTEIGVFPGKELDNELSACVVDICPVGALTSRRFRFAERVWYLDKKPSICTGCDVGCNITLEHRKGKIRRYKPRANPEVNDFWMCDFGRGTFKRYEELERVATPLGRTEADRLEPIGWSSAVELVHGQLRRPVDASSAALLAAGHLTTEAAFAAAAFADGIGTPHRAVWRETGARRSIPNPAGGVSGDEVAPNRRGVELAGLVPGDGGVTAEELVRGDAAADCSLLVVADADFGSELHDAEVVARLRKAAYLVVVGWGVTPLTEVADLVLPCATHAESGGTFVNSQRRLQRFERAFPAPAGVRTALEVFAALAAAVDPAWRESTEASVFARLAAGVPQLAGVDYDSIPAAGISLAAEDEAVA